MPGDFFFLNYGVQDGNVMQGLFRVEKSTLELQVYNGSQWIPVAGGGGGDTSAKAMSTVQRMAFVPASGALIWDTDLERLFIGNSHTAGGVDTTDTNVKSLTTTERMAIVPKQGELIWDTTLGALYIGDGTTQGGVSIGGGGGSGIVAGTRLSFDGDTLNFNPDKQIITISGNTVTLEPDNAYKAYATTASLTIKANPPNANFWGLEGHLELFVAGLGHVITDPATVVLTDRLEPDSVNNCTLRFHDGMCYISVEDHVAGYVVTEIVGSTQGTLSYGISVSEDTYISFDASTNQNIINLGGSTASAEKHVVGNGYADTILTGSVDCGTSKFTVANLGLQNVQVTGGVMTLGDAYIPSGSTVAVSGGSLAVEKVTGAGSDSTIDLGGTRVVLSQNAVASGCAFVSGAATIGGAFFVNQPHLLTCSGCYFGANTASNQGGAIALNGVKASANLSGSTITSNYAAEAGGGLMINYGTASAADTIISGNSTGGNGKDVFILYGSLYLNGGCVLGSATISTDGNIIFKGNNKVDRITARSVSQYGTVTISSGASINLTSSIAPGGGMTVLEGGCTVNGNVIPAGTYTSIDSTGQPT